MKKGLILFASLAVLMAFLTTAKAHMFGSCNYHNAVCDEGNGLSGSCQPIITWEGGEGFPWSDPEVMIITCDPTPPARLIVSTGATTPVNSDSEKDIVGHAHEYASDPYPMETVHCSTHYECIIDFITCEEEYVIHDWRVDSYILECNDA